MDFGLKGHRSLDRFLRALHLLNPCVSDEKIQIANGTLTPIVGKEQIVLFDGLSPECFACA